LKISQNERKRREGAESRPLRWVINTKMPQTPMNKGREAFLVFGKLSGNTKSHK
jgi:hypothetical protein